MTAPGRVAAVVNPAKYDDDEALRSELADELGRLGVPAPSWYETTEDDPGRGQTEQAVADGADLVVVCGGDGTVRCCAAALAGRDVPLALVPAGTGNLLARNLDVPRDLPGAVRVAVRGRRQRLDLAELDGETFAVMGGAGFDALLFEQTSDRLKGRVGWAAYVAGGVRALRRAEQLVMHVDVDGRPATLTGVGLLVANVGTLPAGLTLLPGARPDDGELDIAVLTPSGLADWIGLAGRVAVGRRPMPWHLRRTRGRVVRVTFPHEVPVELDGDLVGARRELTVRVRPSALTVCVPADAGPA